MKKKTILKLVIVIAALVCIVILFYIKVNTPPDRIKSMVADNKAAYDYVANFYYEDFKNNSVGKKMVYSFMYDDNIIICVSDDREITVPATKTNLFKMIEDSYRLDKQDIERVYVDNNFVYFSNINGRESLVYSVDGSKPKYVNGYKSSVSDHEITALKVVGNWYYVYDCDLIFYGI